MKGVVFVKDNVKLFIFVMVLLVLTFAYFMVRFLKEEKRQKAIVAVRNRIEGQKVIGKIQNFRETEQLNMPEESFLQGNEGDDPLDENFPVIKMHSYGEKSDLVSDLERIWW